MRILALFNVKGGVGKTTTAVNLAYVASRRGRRTLLWDLDPQGAASYYLRVRPKIRGSGRKLIAGKLRVERLIRGSDFEGFDLLPADISYRKLDLALDREAKPGRALGRVLLPLAESYDLVFLDCPPGISRLAEAIFVAADGLVVPTIPTPLSVRSLGQIRRRLDKKGPRRLPVLPFLSMVDRRKKLHREAGWVRQASPFKLLDSEVPYSTHIEQMAVRRCPVGRLLPGREPALSYDRLWGEVCGRLDLEGLRR